MDGNLVKVIAASQRAMAVLRSVRRAFVRFDIETFSIIYTHRIEYCNTVTYQVYEKDAKLLEGVQRRATKMVPEMKNYDYANRLKKLALPSLSYRRKRGDMTEVYKYTHGL